MTGERTAIASFFRSIDREDIVALPPNRDRFDQSEGHDEARAIARDRGIDSPNWVFWHQQSAWVFDSNGDLTSGLLIHWGGNHDRVAQALAEMPAPFRAENKGPSAAFVITSADLLKRQGEPFPDVADTAAVKDRIRRITAPVDRRSPDSWTDSEKSWFEAVLTNGDIAAQGYVVRWIVQSPTLGDDTFEALMSNWVRIYGKAPKDVLMSGFLSALDRRDDPRLEEVLDVCESRKTYMLRSGAAQFLAARGAMSDIPRLYRLAQDPGRYEHTPGNGIALRGWIKVRAAHEARTQAAIAQEALGDKAFDAAARKALEKIVERG